MNRNEAKAYCRAHCTEILTRAKKDGFVCELCNSGTGKHGTGMKLGDNGATMTCFSCGFKGDIFDYIAQREGLQKESKEAFDEVYRLFNINIEDNSKMDQKQQQEKRQGNDKVKQEEKDFIEQYKLWNKNISQCKYLKERGIGLEVANKYLLGYAPVYFSELEHNEYALIIPTSKSSYSARNTNKATEDIQRYSKRGKTSLFNVKALKTAKNYVFITEGELDALSIIQSGGEAVGLGSISNLDQLIEALKKNKVKKGLILSFDNDKAGRQATKDFFSKLKENKIFITTYAINIAGECKDVNQLLVKSPAALEQNIAEALANPKKAQYEQQCKSDKGYLEQFWTRIHDEQNYKTYPTGFINLDDALEGGLGVGLTGIGAVSALGKTTFIVQIAYNMAKAGEDVLIFSLELGRDELIAKNISRLSALNSVAMFGDTRLAESSKGVLSGWKWKDYPQKKQDLLYYCKKQYEEFAGNIYTIEGEMDYTIEDVIKRVEAHVEATGKKPVVMIDYLQILGIESDRNIADKSKADKLVKQLRILAREYNIPVIAISSFNRENYNSPVSMSAFKESGGIEYTADCLIGLQFSFMEYQDNEEEKEYKKRLREKKKELKILKRTGKPLPVQAVILKSRYTSDETVNLSFLPKYNLYIDNIDNAKIEIDTVLQKQSKGKGSITSKTVLENYINLHYKNGSYQLSFFGERAVVTLNDTGDKDVLEATEGRTGEWYITDVNTHQTYKADSQQELIN